MDLSIGRVRAFRLKAAGSAAALLLAGCAAVGPDYKPPEPQVPREFANIPAAAMPTAQDLQWWKGFGDPMLEGLVERAIATNPSLREAAARLKEARALRVEARAELYPAVQAIGSYTNQRSSQFTAVPGQPIERESWDVGFDAAWEIDLFGGVRRSIEASQATEQAIEASRRDVLVSLVAELARNYFDMRGAQTRLAVARENADNQRQTLELTRGLFEAGRGNQLDVSRAEAQYNATVASIPPLESAVKRLIHHISVLVGEVPTALDAELLPSIEPRALPQLAGIGSPAELLKRRPDVRSAERELAATTARIGVATADLYPRITFDGNLGYEARHLDDLGRRGSTVFAFVPQIQWSIFEGGAIRARIRAADARAEGALARFDRTVLAALEDTENALTDFGKLQARRASLAASADAAAQAAMLARERFRYGASSQLDVLVAERTQFEAQDRLAESEAATATSLVAVYKALGGGWEVSP